ncbi:TetR/AcrR family transcriptional regulator [Novosphingobium album (ex Hu et al. 2023)]|uniref:TetR/AcrR family transcriptional regulator n=1 Tax=Novosphingobium album (ex Hu et al. 2023) TaxID=2930093 RepID=A0ABT0B5J9_9SPHN|nr:TetR/AcrR family transcriptional regulator [Novosphingobium album (ex Hu et al. 2023)]MCJ2180302.1 TetR/AcrR family transcriptional regulator [Novosphingobium album (ex Hu et al. 2023)]
MTETTTTSRKASRPKVKPTIARIRAAARKVFYAKGFFPASVEEIAEKAGVSRATVYLYYRSKDEMLLDLMRQDLEYQLEIYAELVTVKRISLAAVRKWLLRLRGEQEERRNSLNLFWAGANLQTDIRDPVFQHHDNIIATLGRRFAGFDLDALPRDQRELQRTKCHMMLFMIEGTTVQILEGGPGPSVKVAIEQLARSLLYFLDHGEVMTSPPE